MIWINIILVFLFGALFGFAEILQRYTNTKYNFRVFMSYVYIFLNGMVSVLALFLIKYFKGNNCFETIEIVNILIAGFGGMMILRSSVFSVKHKDDTIEIGLATLFQIFLNRVEKRMKNKSATKLLESMYEIMNDIDFETAKQELPTLCTAFIDNFTKEDIDNLNKKIEGISKLDISNQNKSMQLGRFIVSYCDEEILKTAIAKLITKISTDNNIKDNDIIESLIKQLN